MLNGNLRGYLTKKDKGSMVDFVYVLCALVMVTIIFVIMMDCYSDLDNKTKIEMLGREYILRMESMGYLSEEDQDSLMEELKKYGVIDITLTGTTKEPVDNGNKIILNIVGSLEINAFQLENWLHLKKGRRLVPLIIHKSSTAKN